MSIRISETIAREGTTLRVDGRLLAEDVAELTRASEGAAAPLTLDLDGLLFADAEGVIVLKELRAGGAALRNVPPYVSLLLGTAGPSARSAARAAAPKQTH